MHPLSCVGRCSCGSNWMLPRSGISCVCCDRWSELLPSYAVLLLNTLVLVTEAAVHSGVCFVAHPLSLVTAAAAVHIRCCREEWLQTVGISVVCCDRWLESICSHAVLSLPPSLLSLRTCSISCLCRCAARSSSPVTVSQACVAAQVSLALDLNLVSLRTWWNGNRSA